MRNNHLCYDQPKRRCSGDKHASTGDGKTTHKQAGWGATRRSGKHASTQRENRAYASRARRHGRNLSSILGLDTMLQSSRARII